MSELEDRLSAWVKDALASTWDRRNGQKVPEPADLTLKNEAVDLDAVVLYADLADSTDLVTSRSALFAAEVFKTYLFCAAQIIRSMGGVITAYDGDRIMAVFIGDSKNSNAAIAAYRIEWAVEKIIQPAIQAQYPKNTYVLKQKVGIASSPVTAVRTGVRNANDIVWVGNAANIAAKLAALKSGYSTYITEAVFKMLNDKAKKKNDGMSAIWTDLGGVQTFGRVYGTTYWRSP
ncbi:adenylate/guanylate cyclase domain-containing protein [Gryllotalpicola kribbensis]|uniref:adenylate/guanylate cyclase domain-containing protein n=1 Tax=Gryllotalpicola kribbensis TaxID=993084 RepID=UPI0031D95606